MKIYRIIIRPTTAFGTPLKGDTIFGHFCWQAEEEDLLIGGLDKWIECYDTTPFAVFSSAWPIVRHNNSWLYAFPRPPWHLSDQKKSRKERIQQNKKIKKQKWLMVDSSLNITAKGNNQKTKSDAELFDLFVEGRGQEQNAYFRHLEPSKRKTCLPTIQAHNSINRLTMTTGTGEFAPFSHDNFLFPPGFSLAVFVAADESALSMENLRKGFKHIGSWGFGRDSATGLGRFSVESVEEHDWPIAEKSAACYTLGPCVPQKNGFSSCHATPFTRFGRHGRNLAVSGKPFKTPIVMADEGAVLRPENPDIFKLPYLGTAVKNISAADPRTVTQGYSLYLPC